MSESCSRKEDIRQLQGSLEDIQIKQNETCEEIKDLAASFNSSSCCHYNNRYLQIGSSWFPAASCKQILEIHPESEPGNYWIRSSSGNVVLVYCDMNRHCCGSTGGWMRVAYLDMTDPSQQCPPGFRLITNPKRLCQRATAPGCTSITVATQGVQYCKVCGRVTGYQSASTDAFWPYYLQRSVTLDDVYTDGISITHGQSPRKHIWTFASAEYEIAANFASCPCSRTDTAYTGVVPPFIGNDYFCDTGAPEGWQFGVLYSDNPLWDGSGCGPTSSCCTFNSPPWFCKQLPQPTTDNIEVRVCTNQAQSDEDVLIEQIELYVQ